LIDLHCHILPGVDDGASNLSESIAMARVAASDGIAVIACTPHMVPGLYDNTGPAIRLAVDELARVLADAGIPLQLVTGADVHLAPDLEEGLGSGRVAKLAESRYFLLEPPHHVLPPRLEDIIFQLLTAGYMPIVTHPERLSWVEAHYAVLQRLAASGVWMQVTAGSLTGRFGRRVRYWGERMLDEGIVQILATDAHDCLDRPPRLSEARDVVARRNGEEAAERLVVTHPAAVLHDMAPSYAIKASATQRMGASKVV
jgi:protein-tyrosine phosphatase